MKCFNPDCLHQNPNHNNFCQKCGQKLLLKDHFRGLKYLGEGGFGRTFVGIDEHRRNSPCVIKQFLPLSQGSGALQKCIQLFEQEAELLEKLGKHPQIPDLLAFFEQDNKLYLIQEFVEGEDLLKELQRKGRFTEDEVKTFLLEMLPVLDFIHNKNVIHRDIKPENILRRKTPLDPSIYGQISDLVLIDFGVSKQVSASVITKMGTGVGTIGYTAPEQNRGIAKPASDLYSLAVTAIRLLTGVLPEERNGSMIDEIFDIDDLSWKWKEWLTKNGLSVSNDLANILDKMLADKISDRFQSAREVLEVLNYASNVIQTPIQQSQNYPQVPNPYKTEVITESQQIKSPQSSQRNQQKSPVSSTPSVTTQPKSQQTFWENFFVVGNARKNVIKLKTAKANFNKLDQLLKVGNWQEADIETGKLMLNICRTNVSWLTINDCKHFPREELKIIDNLWIKYSDERFGFSMQKKILIACGGNPGLYDGNVYNRFGDQVGWRKQEKWLNYPALTFNINAPKGHLPGVWRWIGGDVVDELGVEGKVCVFLSFIIPKI